MIFAFQVQTFYEAVGFMICAQTDPVVQEHLIEKYMLLPNQVSVPLDKLRKLLIPGLLVAVVTVTDSGPQDFGSKLSKSIICICQRTCLKFQSVAPTSGVQWAQLRLILICRTNNLKSTFLHKLCRFGTASFKKQQKTLMF